MPEKIDLYNSSYGNYALDVYREVRLETYGEDFGQTSWVTTEESQEIPQLLDLEPGAFVLEIGCGSGGYALHLAKTCGCQIVGLDLNREGIHTANELAKQDNLTARVSFRECDVSQPLSFAEETYNAVFANDVFCHIPRRLSVLSEIRRVLKPGGRLVFSDALVIGGVVSKEEIAIRGSIGPYFFLPPGENEKLIENAGFRLLEARDTTAQAALIAGCWHDAREKRKAALQAIEGDANFEGLQRFLTCVRTLTRERRLLRYLYIAWK